jgi:hypothetical protein
MRLLDVLERFVYGSSRCVFLTAALFISFVKTGIWYMPNYDVWAPIHLDPFHNPFVKPSQHYMFWNWLGPFLAWRLRIHNDQSFLYFHFLFAVAFTGAFVWYVFTHFREKDARSAIVLFLAIPASATAYFWVGMDAITLFLILLILLLQRNVVAAAMVGILLGMQHAEQGVCAFGALALALLFSKIGKFRTEYRLSWACSALVGIMAGKLILVLLFRHYGIEVNSGRPHFVRDFAHLAIPYLFYHWQYILWSVLGIGWLAVARLVDDWKRATPFFIALFGSLLLLLIVIDETRVLAIVTFPLFAAYLMLNGEYLGAMSGRFGAAVFGLWLLVPWPWVWTGKPLVSAFPYDVAWMLHRWFGWFDVPSHQPLWPF